MVHNNNVPGAPQFSRSLFPHKRWLVCRPLDYDVRYKINPWMDLTRLPEKSLARKQWTALHHTLLRLGAWLEYVHHEDGVPDMVFTANAGLVRGSDVVLSRFRHKERQGEEVFFQRWFEEQGFRVLRVTAGAFEGEGDALFAGTRLFCGYGFRSDREAHEETASLLSVSDVVSVQLVDPRFYHLDTCFCPLTKDLALFYPGAFSAEGVRALERAIELIPVPDRDAERFVCNAVVLGKDVVLAAGCEATYSLLAARGFASSPVELSEFIKAGGAAKCLSLRLEQ
jgi:N-dimethylarginine dimethylaminohydrolase